jgi:hypothetical protein
VVWLVLVGAGLAWEIACHRSGARWTSLTEICSLLWTRPAGRLALVGTWAFLGWHFFARYTLHG